MSRDEDRALRRYHLLIAGVLAAIILIDAGIIAYRYLAPARTEVDLTDLRDMTLQVDPDVASADALAVLPGLSARQARAIVEYRNRHRDPAGQRRCFKRPADLDNVHGIGPKTLARIRDYLQFPPASNGSTGGE